MTDGTGAGIGVPEMFGCFGLLLFLGTAVEEVPGGFLVLDLALRFGVAIITTGDAEAATLLIAEIALMSVGREGLVGAKLSSGNGGGAS